MIEAQAIAANSGSEKIGDYAYTRPSADQGGGIGFDKWQSELMAWKDIYF